TFISASKAAMAALLTIFCATPNLTSIAFNSLEAEPALVKSPPMRWKLPSSEQDSGIIDTASQPGGIEYPARCVHRHECCYENNVFLSGKRDHPFFRNSS